MTLLAELEAFYAAHRGCGERDAGVEGPNRLVRLRVRSADRPPCWTTATHFDIDT